MNDAKVGLHWRAPGLGQVLNAELALEQFQLEIEAQHDLQIVGHLVVVSANDRACHRFNGAIAAIGALASCSGKISSDG